MTLEARKELKQRLKNEFGVRFGSYIPEFTYIASTTPANAEKIWSILRAENKDSLLWVGELKPQDKTVDDEKLAKILEAHVQKIEELDILGSEKCLNEDLLGKQKITKLLSSSSNQINPLSKIGNNSTEFTVFAHIAKVQMRKNEKEEESLAALRNQVEFNLGRSLISFRQISNRKIGVGVHGAENTQKLVELLTNSGLVHWVEVKLPTTIHNKYSTKVTQTTSIDSPSKAPIWESRQLKGSGQIIGVGDTGLDYYNCLFYDDANTVPFQRQMETVVSTNHRKIVGYWGLMDQRDEASGHGTHVSGIASGYAHPTLSNDTMKQYNSLAYESKIAFLDAGCDTADGCTCPATTECECRFKDNQICPKKFGVVFLPADLNSGYFPYFYAKGARIITSSWGTGYYKDFSYGYSTSSSEIDQFTWNNKDALPFFAAGNSGGQFGYASITTESESKNAISVGAAQSSFDSFVEYSNYINYETVAARIKQELYQIYCLEGSTYYNSSICEIANKFDATKCCDDGGKCNPIKEDCCGTQDFPDFKIIGFKCCQKCVQYELQNAKAHFDPKNVAQFSARGPALDGRVKPDILAVGDKIMSSLSKGTTADKRCTFDNSPSDSLILHEGTSMASPLAAGAGLLVREFFVRGHYFNIDNYRPNIGLPDPKKGFEPSAALVKAMLVHSAQSMTGYLYLNSRHEWWPLLYDAAHPIHSKLSLKLPYLQGHGRIELNEIMKPIAQSGLYIPRTSTDDRKISTGEVHTYCINVKSTTAAKPFKVTLTWTDYPGTPSAGITLVNDLDLIIVTPSRTVFYGNGVYSHIKYSRSEPDYLNNIETIDWGSEPFVAGKYNIVVRGTMIPKGPQPYALVISGDIESSEMEGGCQTLPNHLMSANDLAFYKSTAYTLGIASLVVIVVLGGVCLFLFAKVYQVTTNTPVLPDGGAASGSSSSGLAPKDESSYLKVGDKKEEIELKTLQNAKEKADQGGYFSIKMEDEDEVAESGESNDLKPKPSNLAFAEEEV